MPFAPGRLYERQLIPPTAAPVPPTSPLKKKKEKRTDSVRPGSRLTPLHYARRITSLSAEQSFFIQLKQLLFPAMYHPFLRLFFLIHRHSRQLPFPWPDPGFRSLTSPLQFQANSDGSRSIICFLWLSSNRCPSRSSSNNLRLATNHFRTHPK